MEYNSETAFSRTSMLLGEHAEAVLAEKHVTVLGVGEVGGHCAEALARCGIGHMFIVDADTVSVNNLNSQIVSQEGVIVHDKAEEMANRIREVSNCDVHYAQIFLTPELLLSIIPQDTDFIVDAVDNVSVKIAAVQYANLRHKNIISSIGMGNRLDPTQVRLGDLFSVTGCPFARNMQRELRRRDIHELPVAYSTEIPKKSLTKIRSDNRMQTPGSVPFVPSAGGIAMAYHVIIKLLEHSMN